MVHFIGVILAIVTLTFAQGNAAHAESWDLGYTNSTPEVEEIPSSISDESMEQDELSGDVKAEINEVNASNEPIIDQEKPPISSNSSITKISTKKNTFGVETVEKPGLKLFVSPVAGLTSVMGNGTVNVTPQYAFGGRVGLLVSDNMMIEGGYTYSVMNTSAPLSFGLSNTANLDIYTLKQSAFDVGGKFFFLGRESRFRPFIGGGLAFANSGLNYNTSAFGGAASPYQDYKMKQLQGLGQLGAEIAITRGVVATAAFKLNGILSNKVESNVQTGGDALEAGRLVAGDSLSHSATYTGTVGVGVYF